LSNPTLKDLVDQLKSIRLTIAEAGVETAETIDVDILALHIEEQIEMSAFDPLSAIADVAVPSFDTLRDLSKDLATAIQDEKNRGALLGKILGAAKGVLSMSGLPLPV
jgi:hypothetical protein